MATTIYSPLQLSQMMDQLGGRVSVLDGYGLPKGVQGQVATLTARMNGFDTKLRQAVSSLQSQLTGINAVVGQFLQSMRTILSLPQSTLTSPTGVPPWNAISTTSAATVIDFSKGSTTKVTITQDTTISLTNGTQGEPNILILTQDATGGHNITFDVSSEGVSQVPTDAGKSAVLAFVYDGTTFLLQGSPITGL